MAYAPNTFIDQLLTFVVDIKLLGLNFGGYNLHHQVICAWEQVCSDAAMHGGLGRKKNLLAISSTENNYLLVPVI